MRTRCYTKTRKWETVTAVFLMLIFGFLLLRPRLSFVDQQVTRIKKGGRAIPELMTVTPATYRFANDVITIWPISFSAPEELWVPVVQYKEEGFAHIIPGNASTYNYKEESAYYEGYR